VKVYKAIVWDRDPNAHGQRVIVVANNLAEAKRKLEKEHGEGRIFYLHNEDEASTLR
jgi:hypothetical protein